MKIKKSIVTKMHISEIKNLDPISVYLEDFGPGSGKITISCWDKSWHSHWSAMGNQTIKEFFLSCDNHYLAKNLSSLDCQIADYERLRELILEFYPSWPISEEDLDKLRGCQEDGRDWVMNNSDIMGKVFGDEWYFKIPQMENPKYKYLCRIIDTVRAGLEASGDIKLSSHSIGADINA